MLTSPFSGHSLQDMWLFVVAVILLMLVLGQAE